MAAAASAAEVHLIWNTIIFNLFPAEVQTTHLMFNCFVCHAIGAKAIVAIVKFMTKRWDTTVAAETHKTEVQALFPGNVQESRRAATDAGIILQVQVAGVIIMIKKTRQTHKKIQYEYAFCHRCRNRRGHRF
jgi:hypothetical protein